MLQFLYPGGQPETPRKTHSFQKCSGLQSKIALSVCKYQWRIPVLCSWSTNNPPTPIFHNKKNKYKGREGVICAPKAKDGIVLYQFLTTIQNNTMSFYMSTIIFETKLNLCSDKPFGCCLKFFCHFCRASLQYELIS